VGDLYGRHGHSRIACRVGAAQVAQVRRAVTKKGKKTVDVVYLITSDRDADPATLAAWVRGHWEIENRLHWVRDVTYQEDKSLVRTGNAPRVMASLRSLAISLLRLDGRAGIAAADRHHARGPQRTLKLLQTGMSGFAVSLAAGLPLWEARSGRALPRRRPGRPAQPRSWRVT